MIDAFGSDFVRHLLRMAFFICDRKLLSFFLSFTRSCFEEAKTEVSTNATTVESTRVGIESAVNELPAKAETLKTEYAAKSKRRIKEVSKSVSATIDVVEDVNSMVCLFT